MPEDILPIFPRGNHDHDEDVYEVVDPVEIDMVVGSLGKLIRSVKSPTIIELLETVRQDVACLGDDELLDIADIELPPDEQQRKAA
jgi:hypothetical protein